MSVLLGCVWIITVISGVLNQALDITGVTNNIPGMDNQPMRVGVFSERQIFQNPMVDIYGFPYGFDFGAEQAMAIIQGVGDSGISGEILFTQGYPLSGPTMIRGNITGLSAGRHGLHIHQSGDMRDDCSRVGEHFNPYFSQHGGPQDPIRHVGDLGNVEAGEDGSVDINMIDPLVSLSSGPRGVVGRCLVVSANPDDFGREGSADSLNNGMSGSPVACGIIAYIR